MCELTSCVCLCVRFDAFDKEFSACSCTEKTNGTEMAFKSDFLLYYNPTFFWLDPVLEGQNNKHF